MNQIEFSRVLFYSIRFINFCQNIESCNTCKLYYKNVNEYSGFHCIARSWFLKSLTEFFDFHLLNSAECKKICTTCQYFSSYVKPRGLTNSDDDSCIISRTMFSMLMDKYLERG